MILPPLVFPDSYIRYGICISIAKVKKIIAVTYYSLIRKVSLSTILEPGNTKGGGMTVPLTSCLIKQQLSVVTQLIPNQSNRRSTVQ